VQLKDFFNTISKPSNISSYMPLDDSLLSQISYGLEGNEDEEISSYDVAIIGIADGISSYGNEGCGEASAKIRPSLASLRRTSRELKIIDLGEIKGKTLNDRYFAVGEVVRILLSYQVNIVTLGGGQDYNLPVLAALINGNRSIGVSIIDSKLDLVKCDDDFSSQTFLTRMKLKYISNIFNLSVIGVQKYYIGDSQERFMDECNWDIIRLRDVRDQNISSVEPYMRDSELVSFDVGSIQGVYMPYYSKCNVNGFSGFESCQIAWYAGVSDHLKCFCLQEYNPQLDVLGKGGILCAQVLWHLFEGMSLKMSDKPSLGSNNYKIFLVHLHEFGIDIRFYTNKANNRWWIEVPFGIDVRLLACSESDFLLSQNGELPERWWKYFYKDFD